MRKRPNSSRKSKMPNVELPKSISKRNTSGVRQSGRLDITLYNTKIVSFNTDTVTLNSGGYKTSTTRRRMNEVSQEYNLGYRVYQVNNTWYVDTKNNKSVPFRDGMKINRHSQDEHGFLVPPRRFNEDGKVIDPPHIERDS